LRAAGEELREEGSGRRRMPPTLIAFALVVAAVPPKLVALL
jgi:hypothetical protein